MTANYALLDGSIKTDPTEFDTSQGRGWEMFWPHGYQPKWQSFYTALWLHL